MRAVKGVVRHLFLARKYLVIYEYGLYNLKKSLYVVNYIYNNIAGLEEVAAF